MVLSVCTQKKGDNMTSILDKLLDYQHTLGLRAKPVGHMKWLSPFIQYSWGQTGNTMNSFGHPLTRHWKTEIHTVKNHEHDTEVEAHNTWEEM